MIEKYDFLSKIDNYARIVITDAKDTENEFCKFDLCGMTFVISKNRFDYSKYSELYQYIKKCCKNIDISIEDLLDIISYICSNRNKNILYCHQNIGYVLRNGKRYLQYRNGSYSNLVYIYNYNNILSTVDLQFNCYNGFDLNCSGSLFEWLKGVNKFITSSVGLQLCFCVALSGMIKSFLGDDTNIRINIIGTDYETFKPILKLICSLYGNPNSLVNNISKKEKNHSSFLPVISYNDTISNAKGVYPLFIISKKSLITNSVIKMSAGVIELHLKDIMVDTFSFREITDFLSTLNYGTAVETIADYIDQYNIKNTINVIKQNFIDNTLLKEWLYSDNLEKVFYDYAEIYATLLACAEIYNNVFSFNFDKKRISEILTDNLKHHIEMLILKDNLSEVFYRISELSYNTGLKLAIDKTHYNNNCDLGYIQYNSRGKDKFSVCINVKVKTGNRKLRNILEDMKSRNHLSKSGKSKQNEKHEYRYIFPLEDYSNKWNRLIKGAGNCEQQVDLDK